MSEPEIAATRLNKYLALHAGVSRREADELITSQSVTINGEVASIGARVLPHDVVNVKGQPLQIEAYRYIALNKPVGYVCSRKRQGENPTIYELLPDELHALKPVGRLDKDSSGLILLTNDGDFAQRMTHPKFAKQKKYEITLDKELEPIHQQMITDYGLQLEDGLSKLLLERMNDEYRYNWRIHMHEGRNRQIRRTFKALGYRVLRLNRISIGHFTYDDIPSGSYREVNATNK